MFSFTRKELYNIPGWRTKRHLVVIESDDWGSIRMPSREVYEEFLRRGIRVDNDPYCRYDALATRHDLENLFEVLSSVKDVHGHPAMLTANAVVANPRFDVIRESGFTQYAYEPFIDTLSRSSAHADAFATWQEGMVAHVFRPQFHGREHLNVKKWLNALHADEKSTRVAFDLGTWGLTQQVDPAIHQYYMGAFNSALPKDVAAYEAILMEGLQLFEQIFGYRSESFVPTTYEWPPAIEPCLVQNGVRYLQGTIAEKEPMDDDVTVKVHRRGFQGSRTKAGLIRLSRNCFFEPSTKPGFDFVSDCLLRIHYAFKWGKAANICAHRLNFIGSIDSSNTDRNLPELRRLLQEIVRCWPDVEFVSSDELGEIIETHS